MRRPEHSADSGAARGRGRNGQSRADQRASTEAAIRWAGIRLLSERGFKDTTTQDIAHAAGVSSRTFFNYFATKDAVVQLPRNLLADNLRNALLARPLDEDAATSLSAAALQTLAAVAGDDMVVTNPLFRAGVRMVGRFPQMQHRAWERRAELEEVAWKTLQERGVRPDDLTARTAVTVVISLAWQAITTWASDDGTASLTIVMSRCLLAVPHPATFAAGLTDNEEMKRL